MTPWMNTAIPARIAMATITSIIVMPRERPACR